MNSDSRSSSSESPAPRHWRLARRALVSLAVVATLIAVAYTVENWRGRRAWEQSRRILQARGELLDWSDCIPAPVPDDQNFFKAPRMQEWFVKPSMQSLSGSSGGTATNAPRPFAFPPVKGTNLVLAEVRVVPPGSAPDAQSPDAVFRLGDPQARERVAALLGNALGPYANGAQGCVLIARPPAQVKPVPCVLQADSVPTVKELEAFLAGDLVANAAWASPDASYLRVAPAGSNTFRVSLKDKVYEAADFLAGTESLTPDFDLVRQALQRPYARIDCDYRQPYAIGIPNFITLRTLAQTLSQRAQCHLLLGRPEEAWHELALVREVCQILVPKPSGRPMTLVAAMINVAVGGLYAAVVDDGLRLHAWREPQLQAIEQQLQAADLLAPVAEAFREERAATSRTFEITPRRELVKLFNFTSGGRAWREELENFASTAALVCIPRGWFYQNMALGSLLEQELIDSIDLTNHVIRPGQAEKHYRELQARTRHRTPYNFLVVIAMPNFLRATQTLARNQTLLNQARIACGLERYRLAEGRYPEKLDALTPGFADNFPHDLIGGQPLKYRRTADGGCLLYSVGWDGKDDGGLPGRSREEGDWVWTLH